jgi:hypothetical protein
LKRLNPTPEERAELVIKHLEQTIREKRMGIGPLVKSTQQKGMSYRQWQEEAKKEIASAIRNAVKVKKSDTAFFNRFLMISGACLVALGFMGAYVAFGNVQKMFVAAAGMALGISFLILGFEWLFRVTLKEVQREIRVRKIARIRSYDKQIKNLEARLEKTRDTLKNELGIYN